MKTKQLALDAMLAAMCAVLGALAIDLNSIKITLESFPILLGALLFGPADGLAIGFVGTFLYQLLRYGVSVTTALWILPYCAAGLLAGWYAKKHSFRLSVKQTIFIAVLAEILTTLLNTGAMYVDSRVFGYWFKGFISAMLVVRFSVCAVKAVIFGLVLPELCAAVRKYVGLNHKERSGMTYDEAMEFIHCTDWKGSMLGMERMRELMKRLGDPQNDVKFIHVAGTNGKGSVTVLLASILTAAGYKTGTYTSPHLERVNERMRINGVEISDESVCALAERVRTAADAMTDKPTEFEIITAMAFLYFAWEKCDIVVLEVGLGGRLDATNVIPVPEAAVIMNIGLEHTAELGDTLAKIAREKAGIIKSGGAVVTYPVNDEVEAVYNEICAECSAERRSARFELLRAKEHSLGFQSFDWGEYEDLKIHLLGEHQLHNAVMAIETALLLRDKGIPVSDEAIREGLEAARWEVRFEVLSTEPVFIADGAHNPQCVEALCRALDEYLPGQKLQFLTGMLADKDYRQMTGMLLPYAKGFVCLTPDSPRALTGEQLAAVLREEGAEAVAADSMEQGIRLALEKSEGTPIVACGSLYMMGELRRLYLSRILLTSRKS